MALWQQVSDWCKVPPIFAFEIKDLLELSSTTLAKEEHKELRNEAVFNGTRPSLYRLVEDVKRTGFLWYKTRTEKASFGCDEWRFFHMN
ncbi:hypothetical protein R6Q57_020687 [Mikania cordata]